MKIKRFLSVLDADFFAGVPDSQLKGLCNYLMATYGIDCKHHIIAANEGNAVALAAGYHLATGKIPVVYMQNSGEGNIINPTASLLNNNVYAIPCIFIIGWRGQPGVHDEPQHIYQGKVTLRILDDMDIAYFVLSKETAEGEFIDKMVEFRGILNQGKQVALVICKDALEFNEKVEYKNGNTILREDAIRQLVQYTGDDPLVSTTGKASRELFEIREVRGEGHARDFLTVGSMGHASSIAFGIALQKPGKKVWILDGDGAVLMHMGAMAVIGAHTPKNLVHVVINNSSHETVGGMPTVGEKISLSGLAKQCGYQKVMMVDTKEKLLYALEELKHTEMLSFLEIKCAIGSRADLGRPTMAPQENKRAFMSHLAK